MSGEESLNQEGGSGENHPPDPPFSLEESLVGLTLHIHTHDYMGREMPLAAPDRVSIEITATSSHPSEA